MTKQFYEEQLPLDEASRDRLWDHGKHAESVFLNQLNFFLIFESLLLGGVINGILIVTTQVVFEKDWTGLIN
jgi:hypothetical protein